MTLMICTPMYGSPRSASVAYAHVVAREALDKGELVVECPAQIAINYDLVRTRSMAVAWALKHGFDHLLFWDSDVVGEADQVLRCLRGMLATGEDFIAADYPRKRWRKGRLESVSRPIFRPGNEKPNLCAARYVGAGFLLLSRECMQKMTAAYPDDDLSFTAEGPDGEPLPCVALFQLMIVPSSDPRVPGNILLSEDFSICERWARMGYEPKLYVGDGAPLDHVGTHRFTWERP